METTVLNFCHAQGRKYCVSVAIINQANLTELAEAHSPTDADTTRRRADGQVVVTISQAPDRFTKQLSPLSGGCLVNHPERPTYYKLVG